ncbi:MAG: hypothetical protein ACHP9T_02340 [Caulobacterales bacterium]
MFEHVTILLSFVFALALTHLLSSATELAIARQTWLQWLAALAMCGLNLVLALTYAMPGA